MIRQRVVSFILYCIFDRDFGTFSADIDIVLPTSSESMYTPTDTCRVTLSIRSISYPVRLLSSTSIKHGKQRHPGTVLLLLMVPLLPFRGLE